jgi:hypothetical protein
MTRKLKGKAYATKEYLFKKNHPILWKIRKVLIWVIKKLKQ